MRVLGLLISGFGPQGHSTHRFESLGGIGVFTRLFTSRSYEISRYVIKLVQIFMVIKKEKLKNAT